MQNFLIKGQRSTALNVKQYQIFKIKIYIFVPIKLKVCNLKKIHNKYIKSKYKTSTYAYCPILRVQPTNEKAVQHASWC